MTKEIHKIHPFQLIDELRYDIVVKYLYFKHLLGERPNIDPFYYETLYKEHIERRTNGIERNFYGQQGEEWVNKRTVWDYFKYAKRLLESLKKDGFKEEFAVPIGNNNLPLNGAHRIAACAALNIPLYYYKEEEPGLAWDKDWFDENKFTYEDIQRIVNVFLKIKENVSIFIFWAPSVDYWSDMEKLILPYTDYYLSQTMIFKNNDLNKFSNLVYDIYHDIPEDIITNKLKTLLKYPTYFRTYYIRHKGGIGKEEITKLKDKIRDSVPIRKDLFITCHSTTGIKENSILADTLFNPINTHTINTRPTTVSDELINNIKLLKQELKKYNIDQKHVCVVGSGALDAGGIRASTDIDFTTTKEIRYKHFGLRAQKLSDKVDIVNEGYHRTKNGFYKENIPDNILISNPDLFCMLRGIKFASLPIISDRKSTSSRIKDTIDIDILKLHGIVNK